MRRSPLLTFRRNSVTIGNRQRRAVGEPARQTPIAFGLWPRRTSNPASQTSAQRARESILSKRITTVVPQAEDQPLYADETRLVRLPEVLAMTGLTKATIYNWQAVGRFPRPLRLGRRAVAWRRSDLINWLEGRAIGGRAAASKK